MASLTISDVLTELMSYVTLSGRSSPIEFGRFANAILWGSPDDVTAIAASVNFDRPAIGALATWALIVGRHDTFATVVQRFGLAADYGFVRDALVAGTRAFNGKSKADIGTRLKPIHDVAAPLSWRAVRGFLWIEAGGDEFDALTERLWYIIGAFDRFVIYARHLWMRYVRRSLRLGSSGYFAIRGQRHQALARLLGSDRAVEAITALSSRIIAARPDPRELETIMEQSGSMIVLDADDAADDAAGADPGATEHADDAAGAGADDAAGADDGAGALSPIVPPQTTHEPIELNERYCDEYVRVT
jgi:hypothetical protein